MGWLFCWLLLGAAAVHQRTLCYAFSLPHHAADFLPLAVLTLWRVARTLRGIATGQSLAPLERFSLAAVTGVVLLVAAGRAANIEDLGLETTRVATDRGIIVVDGQSCAEWGA